MGGEDDGRPAEELADRLGARGQQERREVGARGSGQSRLRQRREEIVAGFDSALVHQLGQIATDGVAGGE